MLDSWLPPLYTSAKQTLLDQIPPGWTELYRIANAWFQTDIIPEVIPIFASCKAVGGNPQDAIGVAAAALATEVSLRILDDLQDQDKLHALDQRLGAANAINYADAFKTLAFKLLGTIALQAPNQPANIYQTFIEGYLTILAGQARDLQGPDQSWQDHWQTMELKTGAAFACISALGAMQGTQKQDLIQACRVYGYHLGMAIQIFNELDGIWRAPGHSDLERGKLTLPLLYALHTHHPRQQELVALLQHNKIAHVVTPIVEILQSTDAKSYLMGLALQQRQEALQSIQLCPDEEGKAILEAHFTAMFGDIESWLNENVQPSNGESVAAETPAANVSISPTIFYRSAALKLRQQLRS